MTRFFFKSLNLIQDFVEDAFLPFEFFAVILAVGVGYFVTEFGYVALERLNENLGFLGG